MGQGQSRSQEIINSSSSCSSLSDKEVIYYTKQYVTISKLIDILISVENDEIKEFNPISAFLIDLTDLIPDIMNAAPSPISQEIYQPKVEIVGIQNGKPVEVFYTVLHEYNDFILKENKYMAGEKVRERAKNIRERFVEINKQLLRYITQYCSEVGILSPE